MAGTTHGEPMVLRPATMLAIVVAIAAMAWLSTHNFLLFHTLVEVFCVVVGAAMFMIVWHGRNHLDSGYLAVIGVAYLFVAALDLVHALTYRGMGIFPDMGADPATQLWIAARGLEAGSLVVAALVAHRNPSPSAILPFFVLVAALLGALFATGSFPTCYVDGLGLTAFKVHVELVIIATLVVALALFWRLRTAFPAPVARVAAAAILTTIAAEVCFTSYVGVYSSMNAAGHLLKLASFVLLYLAVVQTGFSQPLAVLAAELSAERDQLKDALAQVKTLRGLLPICSACKRIRNDRNEWTVLERYIQDHSDANFTHGMCPECIPKYFPTKSDGN